MGDPADQQDQQDQPVGKRGEAAWKEHRQQVAARNERARKEGKARRKESERVKNDARRDRDRRELANLVSKQRDA